MIKARTYANPVPGMAFIHKATAYKVVRWNNDMSLWECVPCGCHGHTPIFYCDAMVRACAGMRLI